LKNELGSERVSIKVIVIDAPEQPQGPLEVSNVKADGCVLTWKAPKVIYKLNIKTKLFRIS
jgi:hypothetical protein